MSRRKREKERRRRRRRRKVARTGVELAYHCQRDKTNHRNNRRPPQPAFHHGHVALHVHTYTCTYTYTSDITARADMTITERLDTYIQIHLDPLLFLCSSLSQLSITDLQSCTIFMHLKIKPKSVCMCVKKAFEHKIIYCYKSYVIILLSYLLSSLAKDEKRLLYKNEHFSISKDLQDLKLQRMLKLKRG